MKRTYAARLLIFATAALLAAPGLRALPQQPADLEQRLQKEPRAHPRLFLDERGLASLKQLVAAQTPLQTFVLKSAEKILTATPVKRKMIGRRLLGVSRTCLKRVVYLAFAHRMTGDERFAARAQREMLAAASFQDWNPSHFLDVAEMTAALAIGYDWLFDALDVDARRAIRDAIVTKGLRTSLQGGRWVTTTNNWNQVCHGGLSLGALAVYESEPQLATKVLRRAIENLPKALHEYAPDGAYPEGPGYWAYGTTYNVLLVDALRAEFGTDFDLSKSKGFLESADYYLHTTGPTGLFYNYSDCGKGGGIAPAMYWFAAARDNPALLWNERQALTANLRKRSPSASQSDRLLPFALIWDRAPIGDKPLIGDKAPIGDKATGDAEVPAARHFLAHGPTPVATHRSAWSKDATFVGIKGGSPGAGHAHMDIGSFVMDANGVRWAADLGSQSYHSLESKGIRLWDRKQDSQRWSVFRLNSLSHNTLVVDGKHQRVKGKAPIVKHTATGEMPHTIVDMRTAYAGQLARAMRGIGLRADGAIYVQDEIQALDRETSVRWGMMTRAKVKSIRASAVLLTLGGQELTMRLLSPAGAKFEVFETATAKAPHDVPNPDTRMVGFTITLPPSASERLAVLLAPHGSTTEISVLPRLRDW
tara:strand:+ start:36798 stop:38741 length:1944 start_codon:yes stop_codon:yes gene_type:complete